MDDDSACLVCVPKRRGEAACSIYITAVDSLLPFLTMSKDVSPLIRDFNVFG